MGIKLDGRDPREFGLIFLKDHYHPHTPEMRRKTLIIPGRPGAWDFGSEWDIRTFSIPFGIIETDRLEMQRKARAFVAFLLDSYGRPREIKLTFDYEPDKYYAVKIAGQIIPERFSFAEQFELPLVSHEPFSKFILPSNEIVMNSDIPIMSDVVWGTGITDFSITKPQTITVINNGNIAIRLSYTLEGTGTNVKFTANGKTMTFGTFTNRTFKVNGDNFTVKLDGVTNLSAVSGEFIELLPGANNIKVTGTYLNLELSENLIYKYI